MCVHVSGDDIGFYTLHHTLHPKLIYIDALTHAHYTTHLH
jgi:hypothetical protein